MARKDFIFINKINEFYKNGFGAEIGVLHGEHAEMILDTCKGNLYLVDPWETQKDWNSKL